MPIRSFGRPERLAVPLAPCGRGPARPIVAVGDKVAEAQKIAEAGDDRYSVDIYAPMAGVVSSFTTATVAMGDHLAASPAIELTGIESGSYIKALRAVFDWRAAGNETLRPRIAEGGLTTGRHPLEPVGKWLERAIRKKCEMLIANAMENQPFVTADHRLLVEHGNEIIRGLAILGRALEAREMILAVDQRYVDDYRLLVDPARMYQVNLVSLPHKYPIGADKILVKVLTDTETPPEESTMDVGAAVIDVSTCFAVYRWVACGQPQLGRVVTVSGEFVGEARNTWAPFGANCFDLAKAQYEPVLHGPPMTGIKCSENTVVSPCTNAVLAVETTEAAPPTPCIRCGWCTDHCPARLNVAALNDAYELTLIKRARRMQALGCVECGACTYVCPARLPLSQRVKKLKRAIRRRRARLASELI